MSEGGNAKLRAASVVAQVAELSEVRLQGLSSSISVDVEDLIGRGCALGARAEASYTYEEAESRLLVMVHARVSLSDSKDGPDDRQPLFLADARFLLVYDLPKEAPPEDERELLFGSFASLNGVYNAWPYLRELVQTLTTRMGLPGLLIPLYKVPRAGDDHSEPAQSPKLKLVAGVGR